MRAAIRGNEARVLRLHPRDQGRPSPGPPPPPSVASKGKPVRRGQRRLALAASSALMVAGLLGAGAGAEPTAGEVSFSVPSLFPRFGPHIHDYVVRCNDGPVTVKAHAAEGWKLAVANHPFQGGDFNAAVR